MSRDPRRELSVRQGGCEPYGHQLRRRCSRAASRYTTARLHVRVRASLGALPRRALHRGCRHSPSFPCDFTCTSFGACEASTGPMFFPVRGDRVLPGVRWRHDLQSLSCCGSLSAKKETTVDTWTTAHVLQVRKQRSPCGGLPPRCIFLKVRGPIWLGASA
jgi:hypothetical protein